MEAASRGPQRRHIAAGAIGSAARQAQMRHRTNLSTHRGSVCVTPRNAIPSHIPCECASNGHRLPIHERFTPMAKPAPANIDEIPRASPETGVISIDAATRFGLEE